MAQWMQCNFIQTVPTWADAACNIRPDTHDGDDSNIKKRIEDVPGFDEPSYEARRKEALRSMLQQAVDPQPVPVPQEALALAKPFMKRAEGRVQIDWKRLERESVVREQLYAMAAEHARQRELEEDEEDVLTLLLH